MSIKHYCDFCGVEVSKMFIGGVIAHVEYIPQGDSFYHKQYESAKSSIVSIMVKQTARSENKDVCHGCLKKIINSIDTKWESKQ